MEKTTETATVNSQTGEEERMRDEYQELIQTLPKESDWIGGYLYLYQGCWCLSMSFQGLISFQRHFQAHDTDVIIITPPKSGTTWLKALALPLQTACITHSLKVHCSIPTLTILFLSLSLTSTMKTHFQILKTFIALESFQPTPLMLYFHPPLKIPSVKLCICVVFIGKLRPETVEAISLDQIVDMFSRGLTAYGPFWDHVLGYWKASQEMPNKVLFLQYEDMKVEIVSRLKTLADFMGCPFSLDEEKQGMVEEIASFCGFDNLKDLEVNKTGKQYTGRQNNFYFRKGEVGDWANYLTPTMVERMEKLMEEKLEGSGFTFKRS